MFKANFKVFEEFGLENRLSETTWAEGCALRPYGSHEFHMVPGQIV